MALDIGRRQFISALGGASLGWPLAARAQQPAMPAAGYLSSVSPNPYWQTAFRQGLSESGYIEGQNIVIEYRWAEGQNDRLPALAADLARRQVTVIAAMGGGSTALAAKAATTTIPIVFQVGVDPVAIGLVASLNRPGGNITGATSLNTELGPKRLQLLHEMVPTATIVALLVNPTNSISAQNITKEMQEAARALGLQLPVLQAGTERELDTAFATLIQLQANALVIGPDPFFTFRSEQLAALTGAHSVPAVSPYRQFAAAGGLMSYGGSVSDQLRMVGVYTGRILKGEKPADLPVQQSTKVELIINTKTAQTFGLTFPLTLLGRADEVIE